MLKVEMLSTGDEVLHGQILDTNAAWLADYFFHHGIPLSYRSTVGDNLATLIETLQSRSRHVDILIVNGGLGPTTDDLSALAAAQANNETLVEHAGWLAQMQAYFSSRGRVMPDTNRKQAMLPASAELVDNPVGTACGFMMKLNQCLLFFTPGVPSEFKVMIETQILPKLRQLFPLPAAPICLRMTTMGCSESGLATQLDPLPLPPDCVLGYRSAMPIIELKLTGPAQHQSAMQQVWQHIRQLVSNNILFEGTQGLAQAVAEQLRQRQLTLAIFEQFTAGLMTYQLNVANAAVLGSEVLAQGSGQSLAQLLASTQQWAKRYQADVTLCVGNVTDNIAQFVLLTPQHSYALSLKYTSRPLLKETQYETVSLLAQHILQRWLNKQDLPGEYEWIKPIDYIDLVHPN